MSTQHQVDRLTSRAPFTAMCGYRRGELGDDAVGRRRPARLGAALDLAHIRVTQHA